MYDCMSSFLLTPKNIEPLKRWSVATTPGSFLQPRDHGFRSSTWIGSCSKISTSSRAPWPLRRVGDRRWSLGRLVPFVWCSTFGFFKNMVDDVDVHSFFLQCVLYVLFLTVWCLVRCLVSWCGMVLSGFLFSDKVFSDVMHVGPDSFVL